MQGVDGQEKRDLVFKDDGQEYAQVVQILGDGKFEARCIDGVKRMCHIRRKVYKKVWISAGDLVLVSLRDFQDDKADIIVHKYYAREARRLKAYGELPDNIKLTEGINDDDDVDGLGDLIEFEDGRRRH